MASWKRRWPVAHTIKPLFKKKKHVKCIVIEFKKGYRPRSDCANSRKGDLLAGSHSNLNRWKSHFCWLPDVKAKSSLPSQSRHKEGVKVWWHSFFSSSLDSGERSGSRSSRFIPGKDYRHLFNKDAGWVQKQSGLFEEKKHLARFKPITVQPVSPVAISAVTGCAWGLVMLGRMKYTQSNC
jgi:hypothetical protein